MLSPAVGASILESLTTGTYSDPMVLYREYVQNSCDALDEAISQGMLIRNDFAYHSRQINLDHHFDDNGIGVPSDHNDNSQPEDLRRMVGTSADSEESAGLVDCASAIPSSSRHLILVNPSRVH